MDCCRNLIITPILIDRIGVSFFTKVNVIILSLAFLNSGHSQSDFNFVDEKVIERFALPLPDESVASANVVQFSEDKSSFFVYFYPSKYIYEYDIQNRTIKHKIPLPRHLYMLSNFYVVNPDSIFVFGHSEFMFNSDSSFVLINQNGIIKDIYPLIHPNTFNSVYYKEWFSPKKRNDEFKFDSIIFPNNHFDVQFNKIKPVDGFYNTFLSDGNYAFPQWKHPLVAFFDFKKDQYIVNTKIWYPDLSPNKYFPQPDYVSSLINGENDRKILTFGYTYKCFELDSDLNVVDTITSMESKLIDLPEPLNRPSDVVKPATVEGLFYISSTGVYCRIRSVYDRFYCVFSDKNMNYLGEDFIEHFPVINDSRGYWTRSVKGDSLIFELIELKLGRFSAENAKHKIEKVKANFDKMKSEAQCSVSGKKITKAISIIQYLEKFNIKNQDCAIAIINEDACPACVKEAMQFLSLNKSFFFSGKQAKPFFLIYRKSKADHKSLERGLKFYGLSPNSHVFTDTIPNYNIYNPFYDNNPRLIIIKKGKIKHDKMYRPDDLDAFPDDVFKYYGIKLED